MGTQSFVDQKIKRLKSSGYILFPGELKLRIGRGGKGREPQLWMVNFPLLSEFLNEDGGADIPSSFKA